MQAAIRKKNGAYVSCNFEGIFFCAFLSFRFFSLFIKKAFWQKTVKSNLIKYNVEHTSQLESVKEKVKNIFIKKYDVSTPLILKSSHDKAKIAKELNWKRKKLEEDSNIIDSQSG